MKGPSRVGVRPTERPAVVADMGPDRCDRAAATDEQPSAADPSPDGSIGGESVLDADLPSNFQSTLGRFLGRDPVATLGDWALEIRDRTDGDAISVADLCHAERETAHRGTMDGDRYYFACFYDAIVLAALTDGVVDIRTRSPTGDSVEVRADGATVLSTTPDGAVASFGIDESVDPPEAGDEPTLQDAYAAVCPYVKAFPTEAAYERWAERVPAATVGMPIAASVDLAAALAE